MIDTPISNTFSGGRDTMYSGIISADYKDRLGRFVANQRIRIEQIRDILIEKGMTERDAEALLWRMSNGIPMINPGFEHTKQLEAEWLRRHCPYRKSGSQTIVEFMEQGKFLKSANFDKLAPKNPPPPPESPAKIAIKNLLKRCS